MAKSKKQEGSKWPWIIGLGAAAGGGMLIYLTRRNKPFEVVEAEADDIVVMEQEDVPSSSGGLTLVGAIIIPTNTRKNPATMTNPVIVRVHKHRKRLARNPSSANPLRGGRSYNTDVGWLGPVVLMGHTIQALQVKFLYDKGHTSPYLPTRGDGSYPSVASRYTSKYAEFPSPVCWGNTIKKMDSATVGLYCDGKDKSYCSNIRGSNGSLKMARPARCFEDAFEGFARNTHMWGWGFALPMVAGLKAINASQNKAMFDPLGAMKYLNPGHPKAWVDESKKKPFYDMDYYRKARWLVWAAEMYREHYASAEVANKATFDPIGAMKILKAAAASPPGAWRFYCQQWCIGIPTTSRVSQTSLLPGICNGVHPQVVMQRIMEQIPPPGRRTLVEELSSGSLADWPETLVALAPPTRWFVGTDEWIDYCHAVQDAKSGSKIERAFVRVLMSLQLAALSTFGVAAGGVVAGVVGGVLGGAAQGVIKAAVDAAINYAATGKTPTFEWSDALAIIADKIDIDKTQFPNFAAAANHYNHVRAAMDGNWGYAEDLMNAIEDEYMGILP